MREILMGPETTLDDEEASIFKQARPLTSQAGHLWVPNQLGSLECDSSDRKADWAGNLVDEMQPR